MFAVWNDSRFGKVFIFFGRSRIIQSISLGGLENRAVCLAPENGGKRWMECSRAAWSSVKLCVATAVSSRLAKTHFAHDSGQSMAKFVDYLSCDLSRDWICDSTPLCPVVVHTSCCHCMYWLCVEFYTGSIATGCRRKVSCLGIGSHDLGCGWREFALYTRWRSTLQTNETCPRGQAAILLD